MFSHGKKKNKNKNADKKDENADASQSTGAPVSLGAQDLLKIRKAMETIQINKVLTSQVLIGGIVVLYFSIFVTFLGQRKAIEWKTIWILVYSTGAKIGRSFNV